LSKALVSRYNDRTSHAAITLIKNQLTINTTNNIELPVVSGLPYSPFTYARRVSKGVQNIGGDKVPVVIADYSQYEKITAASLFPVGYNYQMALR